MNLTHEVSRAILAGFDLHYDTFRKLCVQAKECYERGDWKGARAASATRIQSYDNQVRSAIRRIQSDFPWACSAEALWPEIKRDYSGLLFEHRQPECAETFYNSVACGVLHRRYYRNEYIFFRPAISTDYLEGDTRTYRSYYADRAALLDAFGDMLRDFELQGEFEDLERDCVSIVQALDDHFGPDWECAQNFQVQVLSTLFFRNKAAYAVGRILNGDAVHPFVVPILKDRHGELYADAFLLDPRSLGRVFSLARAYFMVDMEVPSAYVNFLSSVVPSKSRAEIYTMLGLQKQGKNLFYRDLQQHLKHSSDQFVFAPGQRGMVMLVFTLPSFPYVFKVIRDWFDPPKDSDRTGVREKYTMVKYHDRVGRMADTLEYSNVGFPLERFSQAVRDEFDRVAPSMFEIDGDTLVIRHLYIERRMTPLDVYLSSADEPARHEALDELGKAIKELTAVDIFPGDLPLKNFGVTRYGKVVFYDYDEICPLTECNFRALPPPRSHEDEMSAEPWFLVGKNDVFPEEFPRFLFRDPKLREVFLGMHGELATVAYWQERQHLVREGREDNVYPYAEELRFVQRRVITAPQVHAKAS
jgi:isocitrate dehydrogenase kinase/phosphatase